MARYDYKCTVCGNVFEVNHGMTEHPEVTCPECGKPATRQFCASGIVFKGSGFYNTDQRGGSKTTPATAAPKAETAKEGNASTTGAGAPASCPGPAPAPAGAAKAE